MKGFLFKVKLLDISDNNRKKAFNFNNNDS